MYASVIGEISTARHLTNDLDDKLLQGPLHFVVKRLQAVRGWLHRRYVVAHVKVHLRWQLQFLDSPGIFLAGSTKFFF